jgi:hypothetical protein
MTFVILKQNKNIIFVRINLLNFKMDKDIKISIQPCHENWSLMSPTKEGRFCNVCKKNVYDFTKKTDKEIADTFSENEKLCGRFKNSQLNRNLVLSPQKKSFWRIAIASIITYLGIGNHSAKAQIGIPVRMPSEYYKISNWEYYSLENQTLKNEFPQGISILKISIFDSGISLFPNTKSGIVYDKNDLPIPEVYIANKKTATAVRTDSNGNFSIVILKEDDILICIDRNFEIINDAKILISEKKYK